MFNILPKQEENNDKKIETEEKTSKKAVLKIQ